MKKSIVFIFGILALSFVNAQDVSVLGPFEIEGGWSNEVVTAEGKTEYVVAFTDTTTPHSFTVPSGVHSMEYLVVAGGGGGGGYHGGGGGAGGMLQGNGLAVNPGDTITVTVGQGGPGGASKKRGSNGTDSSIQIGGFSIVAIGGGGGGGYDEGYGAAGGSGGPLGCGRTLGTVGNRHSVLALGRAEMGRGDGGAKSGESTVNQQ
jgi:hypothetical protein